MREGKKVKERRGESFARTASLRLDQDKSRSLVKDVSAKAAEAQQPDKGECYRFFLQKLFSVSRA